MSPFFSSCNFQPKKPRDKTVKLTGNPFDYEPLSGSDAIRLLQLDIDADGVACKVIHSSLKHENSSLAQEYVALSYTWGDPHPVINQKSRSVWETYPIISCNGQKIRIQRNLFEALQMLKSLREFRHIWVDALCINQGDDDERRSQVAIMGYIYAGATEVIVWLGFEDATTESAASLIAQLSPLVQNMHLFENPTPGHFPVEDVGPIVEDLVSPETVIVFYHLLSRTWFRRGWVVQEAALAQRCKVLCGRHEFDLTTIWILTMILGKLMLLQKFFTESEKVYAEGVKGMAAFSLAFSTRIEVERGAYRAVQVQKRLRKRYGSIQDQQLPFVYLEELLVRSKVFEFTRAEDRLLAPMALVRTIHSPQHDSADYFELPHRTSVRDIHIGFTRLIVETRASLSILSLAGSKLSDSDLPTWVPNFDSRMTSLYQENFDASRGWLICNDRNHGFVDNNSHSRKQTYSSIHDRNPLLAVTAIFFDNIAVETRNAPLRPPRFSESFEWFQMLEKLPSIYVWSGEPRIVSLCRTLLANHSLDAIDDVVVDELPPHWFEEAVEEEFENAYKLFTEGDQQKSEHSVDMDDFHKVVLPVSEEEFVSQSIQLLALKMLNMALSLAHDNNEIGPFQEFSSTSLDSLKKEYGKRVLFQRLFTETYLHTAAGRRLALTQKQALCLVPGASCVGDHVAFLRGSDMPFILRPGSTADNFILIGEAYVHGLMGGKAMELGLQQKSIFLE